MILSPIKAKLCLILRYLFVAKKSWRWPRISDVLIYDASSAEILLVYLHPWRPEILHCRGEDINVLVLLASLVRKGNRWRAYVDEFIERVQPRLVVTFVDNNPGFYTLAARHKKLKTMFIQNGYRGYYLDVFEHLSKDEAPRESYKVDYMLTFGSLTGAEYAKYIRGAVIPIGSITNNHIPRKNPNKGNILAFVSQYKQQGVTIGGHHFSHEEFYRKPDSLILKFLVRYASARAKKLLIVTRSRCPKELKEEQAYFCAIVGPAASFAGGDWFGDSYEAVDSAEVVVSNTSTLGLESAARNRKTAFFTIHKHIYEMRAMDLIWDRGIGWPKSCPEEGPFWTNHPDPASFERILDHLFAIDEGQWQTELADCGFADIITYDPGNTILRAVLRKELGQSLEEKSAASPRATPTSNGSPFCVPSTAKPRRSSSCT